MAGDQAEGARPEIPDHIRRFVLTSIPSVPHLEALLLLRSSMARAWVEPDLARRLYVPEGTAVAILREFEQAGLVTRRPGGEFQLIEDPAIGNLVAELAEVYGRHLVRITDLVHSRMDRRALKFADAFRLNKEAN